MVNSHQMLSSPGQQQQQQIVQSHFNSSQMASSPLVISPGQNLQVMQRHYWVMAAHWYVTCLLCCLPGFNFKKTHMRDLKSDHLKYGLFEDPIVNGLAIAIVPTI